MARCEICNRKLKDPGYRFCGKNKCIAKEEQKLPRCTVCHGLAVLGEPCPGGVDTAGNMVGNSIHHFPEGGKALASPERRKEAV
jgi:hypothetical protein